MRRRRRTDGEINLTPLLDVLFVILFVKRRKPGKDE